MRTYSPKIIFFYCPLFIILYNLTGNLSNDIYLPTLPALANELNTTSLLTQLTLTSWFLGVAFPQIYFGLIADYFGYRPIMLWGALIFLIATLGCGLSPNIYCLLICRFFQGIGVSSLNIATFATVRSAFYDEKISVKFISWINITGSLAPLVGPVVGSFLFQLFGWRSTFSFILALGIVSIIGLYFFMIEGNTFQQQTIELNLRASVTYYKAVINKKLFIPIITYTAFLAAMIAYLTTAPFIIHDLFEIPIKYFGLTQILPFSFFILGGLTINKLVGRFKLSNLILLGLSISGISLLLWISMILIPQLLNIYTYLFAVALFLFGFAIVGGPLISNALSSSTNKGGAAALLGLSMALMASLASLLTALFYNGTFLSLSLIISIFISLGILNFIICRNELVNDSIINQPLELVE